MHRWCTVIFVTFSSLGLSGCRSGEYLKAIDELSFTLLGRTLFQDVERIDLKQVHDQRGSLLGKEVVVEGELIDLSDHLTHFVISDGTARMVIVLTEIERIQDRLEERPGNVRVLGSIESGEGDQPYVLAREFKILPGAKG